MSLVADLQILWQLALVPVRGSSHAERMESFYCGQAASYDDFRDRLLHGRAELMEAVPLDEGSVWLDLGGGTGTNLELTRDRVRCCRQVYLVDLAPSLLHIARRRAEARRWTNVSVVQADATQFAPPEPVDLVTFSYSLTMIPDWYAAIDRAWQMLRPGGTIGVVDFYVSRKYSGAGTVQHNWFTRNLLPLWFGSDNVMLSPDHIAYLRHRFETVDLRERRGRIPYLPLVSAPYYLFIGRKPGAASDSIPTMS